VHKHFSITPPENSGGAEKSTENSGSHAKNFFCSMYEMSQRHPVWVAENHVNPCNSVETIINQLFARPARAVSAAGNMINQPQVGKSLLSQ
jgi:hypothetical protein